MLVLELPLMLRESGQGAFGDPADAHDARQDALLGSDEGPYLGIAADAQ